MPVVPARVLDALAALEPEADADTRLAKVVEEALVRRLHHYSYVDRHMQQKYGMSWAEFRDRHVVEEKGHTFEAESDFWEWELAQDGIRTMERRLQALRQPADDGR